jgi:lipopolysaccharide transport system ATP-binding protein
VLVNLKGIGKQYKTPEGSVWALKDIDLNVEKNQRVGIIGPNGSGKSTLLKIISGITQCTTGSAKIKGRVVSLADLESGFHLDLTGRENILVNGMLVGMGRDEVLSKRDEIIKFADIGKYIDIPFYTYSQGMKFRLAFAVAVMSKCDLMVLDEIFVAGDIKYQLKVMKAIKKMQKNTGMTTIVSSHILAYAMALADTFYYLSNGKMKKMSKKEVNLLLKKESFSWEKELGVYFGYSNTKKSLR